MKAPRNSNEHGAGPTIRHGRRGAAACSAAVHRVETPLAMITEARPIGRIAPPGSLTAGSRGAGYGGPESILG